MRSLMAPLVFGTAFLAAGCGETRPDTPAVTKAESALPATPSVAQTRADPASTVINVSGPIIVEHQVDITAQHEGVLAKIFFDAPARVKSGTVLDRMDDHILLLNGDLVTAQSPAVSRRI